MWWTHTSQASALPPGDRHSVEAHRDIVAALRADSQAELVRAMDAHFEGSARLCRRVEVWLVGCRSAPSPVGWCAR